MDTAPSRPMLVLVPGLVFCAEGCFEFRTEANGAFMVVSFDGSIRDDNALPLTLVVFQIRRPINRIHTEFPSRHLVQCFSETAALDIKYLSHLRWANENTVVFQNAM